MRGPVALAALVASVLVLGASLRRLRPLLQRSRTDRRAGRNRGKGDRRNWMPRGWTGGG